MINHCARRGDEFAACASGAAPDEADADDAEDMSGRLTTMTRPFVVAITNSKCSKATARIARGKVEGKIESGIDE